MNKETQQVGLLEVDGMLVEVKILEVRSKYGNIRYRVEPVAGSTTKEVWKEKIIIKKIT